jgi:toxin FitB
MIVLDTNVLSALMLHVPDQTVAAWLDKQPPTSVWTTSITLFEIRFGLEVMPVGKRRTQLFQDLERLLVTIDYRIAPFDTEAAQYASALMASRKSKGRPRELRDTMIAGIVVSHNATLATRNVRDFDDISAMVVSPWAAERS